MRRTHVLVVVAFTLTTALWLAASWIVVNPTPVVAALPSAQQQAYTVTFQYGITPAGYTGVADVFMNGFLPTERQGGHGELWIRSDSWYRSLIRFDLSQHIPEGAQVLSATLYLHVLSQSQPAAMRVVAFPVIQPWAEYQVNWNEAQTGVAWSGGGGCEGSSRSSVAGGQGTVNQSSGRVPIDVTSAAQAWVDNPSANQGVLLKGESLGAGVSYRFASSNYQSESYRPSLVVKYLGSPPLATATPTQTPTRTPTPTDYTVITSTLADWAFDSCLKVGPEQLVSNPEQMVLIWQGTPWWAELRLTVCNSDRPHPIFLNGVQVGTTPTFSVENCECNETQARGYRLSFPFDLALLNSGPSYANVITFTNAANPWDSVKIYNAHIVMVGQITSTSRAYFTVGLDYDGTAIKGGAQLPIGYNPAMATPLLVSLPGTGEDKDNALIRYMTKANEMGWLLASLDMRRGWPSVSAKLSRSPSLLVQGDVMNLVAYMQAHYNVDPTRIYIAGFSAGAGMAVTIAAKYPDVFAGVLDYAGPTDYAEWYAERLDIATELQSEFGGTPTNNFEFPRRSSRWLARNLRYVPMRIVHGTADDRVLFTQSSRLYYEAMPPFYDPAATLKEFRQHAGGHADHVDGVSDTDLQFLAQHTLLQNPRELSIITDEGKAYYWLSVEKKGVLPKAWRGFVEMTARYDLAANTVWLTAKDGNFAEGKALTVTLDLAKMGLDAASAYDVEEYDERTGDFVLHSAVVPVAGKLILAVPVNSLGLVNRQFVIYRATGRPLKLLRLQQGLDGYTQATDTWITWWTSEGTEQPHGTATTLAVTYDGRRKALLKFDLGGLSPTAQIKAAKLTVNLVSSRNTMLELGVYETLRSWIDSQATWQWASLGQPWSAIGAESSLDRAIVPNATVGDFKLAKAYAFNLKSLVERWFATPSLNNGVFLIGNGTYTQESYPLASAEWGESSKRPVLEIWYLDPLPPATSTPTPLATQTATATPTAATPTGTASATLTATPTASPTPTRTATPTLTPSVTTVLTSTTVGCMDIQADGLTRKSAQTRVLLMWQGTPAVARLVLNSCGVGPGRHHSVYLNGQKVTELQDDVYNSCFCYTGGRTVTYTLSSPSPVISGWNYISVTNDSDVQDSFVVNDGRLVLEGALVGSVVRELTFTSNYDGSARHAVYQLPVAHRSAERLPLVVSIGGIDETKWDALLRLAEGANARGWLLLALDIRSFAWPDNGLTASLAVQHDIMSAIDHLLADPTYKVDPSRIYLSGFDSGGGIAATVAAKYPHRIAGVADWGGPTDLKEWAEQNPRMEPALISDIGYPYTGPGNRPMEWTRRSARVMATNLKYVGMAVVHGRNDTVVPFGQSFDFYGQMQTYYVPENYNKRFVWHDGGQVDSLPGFDALDFLAGCTLNANPLEIMIRADENKDYYWVRLLQKDWNGNVAVGFSSIGARYDPATRVISATIRDERAFLAGNLPVDVSFDLTALGLDPGVSYTVEDYNIATGDFEVRSTVPISGRVTVSLPRDRLAMVHHQYLIYPFPAPATSTVAFQQGTSPTTGYSGAADTYVYQFQATTNYSTSTELRVNFGGSLLSLLKYDLSAIPAGAVIKKAQLVLTFGGTYTTGLDVSVYPLLANWVHSEATWQQAAAGVPWSAPGIGAAGQDYDPNPLCTIRVLDVGAYIFNVTSLVRRWQDGVLPNRGFLIAGPRSSGSGAEQYRYWASEAGTPSLRPRLEIVYMMPTPTPTASPTFTATPTLSPTATQTLVATPTLTPAASGTPSPTPTPTWLPVRQVLTSTNSLCMEVRSAGPGGAVQSAEERMLMIWEGSIEKAYLVMNSCGVKPGVHHTIYLNGKPAAQAQEDPFYTCFCDTGGRVVTYTLSSPNDLIVSGWNGISITNDADVTDSWLAYGARLVVEGYLRGTVLREFAFTSSYDGSTRYAAYQLPVGYDPAISRPLLVSIGGYGETQWNAIHRYAEQSSERGWLLLGCNVRRLDSASGGRTASLATQHDIIDAINYLKASFNVDSNRVYISGFSSGAGVLLTTVAKYPHVFAAAADWAGPTDLVTWVFQRPTLYDSMIRTEFGCAPFDLGSCPWEWQRRSAIHLAQNLKHVPLVIVHGPGDPDVWWIQTTLFWDEMSKHFDPGANNKLLVEHNIPDHIDELAGFDGLDFLDDFTLNANPRDVTIRTDESKDFYWVSVTQKNWNGNWADGYSSVVANYDPATRIISATVWDERAFRDGTLPLDVSINLQAIGFDPLASYTVEDYNLATEDFELRNVAPVNGRLTLSLARDSLGQVWHQYLIYPYPSLPINTVILQQRMSPTSGYTGTKDTYIYRYAPTTNYGSEAVLKANFGASQQGLIRFDLSPIPAGAQVKEAYLTVYLANANTAGMDISLYTLRRYWSDREATWELAAAGQPWGAPGAGAAGTDYDPLPVKTTRVTNPGLYTFAVKPLVQNWLNGTIANQGIVITGPRADGSGAEYCDFASAEAADGGFRPKLEVVYVVPTPTPTPTPTATPTQTATPTKTSTPTATATPTGALSPTPTPTLTATVSPTPTVSVTPTASPTTTQTPQPCSLQGSVLLQRSGMPAPHPSWSVMLTVNIDGRRYVVPTDTSGTFTITGLSAGTYNIRVKNSHTLANVRNNVTLVAGLNTVHFGTLAEGDANDDNCVTITDFSVLASGFFPQFDPRADFNNDGYVNILDFSMLRENFAVCGDLPVASP
jgi:poly(3-hydroxybutyrate) depolymerase